MIFSSERITTNQAHEYGILEVVYSEEDFLNQVITYAEKIIKNGPLALKLAKQAINEGINLSLEDSLKLEHELYKQTIPSEDRKEGLKAFKEKRKPKYKGS